MKTEGFKTIETTLGITLPTAYKTFMLNYPADFYELGEPYNGLSWLYLKADPKDVIDANELFREAYEGENFIKYMFVIGNDGCGNDFFISTLNDAEGKVYSINHETGDEDLYKEAKKEYDWKNEKMIRAENIEEYTQALRNMFENFS